MTKNVVTPSELTAAPTGQFLIYRDGANDLRVRLDGETIWLTQKQIAELYQVSPKTVSEHLRNVVAEEELQHERSPRTHLYQFPLHARKYQYKQGVRAGRGLG